MTLTNVRAWRRRLLRLMRYHVLVTSTVTIAAWSSTVAVAASAAVLIGMVLLVSLYRRPPRQHVESLSADHEGLPDRASLEKDADFSVVTPSPECQDMLDELGK